MTSGDRARGEAHRRLGRLLREAREHARKTTRDVKGYTSGWISQIETGQALPSPELLDYYVERFGAQKAALNEAYLLAQAEAGILKAPRASTKDEQPSFSYGLDFVVERLEIEYVLPSGPGMPADHLEFRRLRARRNGIQSWWASFSYDEANPDPDPTVTLYGPGQLELVSAEDWTVRRNPGYTTRHQLTFPSSLNEGEVVDFAIHRRHLVDFSRKTEKGRDDCRYIAPRMPMNYLRIAVRFPSGLRPEHVWHYERARDSGPGTPDASKALEIDQFGRVSFAWESLDTGYAYGVAWIW